VWTSLTQSIEGLIEQYSRKRADLVSLVELGHPLSSAIGHQNSTFSGLWTPGTCSSNPQVPRPSVSEWELHHWLTGSQLADSISWTSQSPYCHKIIPKVNSYISILSYDSVSLENLG
jgi:hypothetical protein